ncbi:MAG: DUF3365 domain-containing protein [candidate division Zixibacteria bacterium]|nr:DUF3365 domain-containing protein [candidate division Zixibacteria bacterium]
MKTLTCLFLALLIITGCKSNKPENVSQNTKSVPPSAADEQLYTEAARNLAGQLDRELQNMLLSALAQSGPAYALDVYQVEAPEITAAHNMKGWKVKRVSEQWRTIAGRPDSSESAALARFANPATKENSFVGWSGPDSARVFHYYEKITVREVCLKCHGDLQTVDLDLWKQVKITYPWDKATGYREGDLRGMFVVDAQFPGDRDVAKLLAQGTSVSQIVAADPSRADSSAKPMPLTEDRQPVNR